MAGDLIDSKTRKHKTDKLSDDKIDEILVLFPTTKTGDLAREYGVPSHIVTAAARAYGINKDAEWLRKVRQETLVHRNKNLIGRDLTPNLLKEIALLYNSKREFAYKDASAYTTANKLGIMDEITKHMVSPAFSIPQIITRQITEYLFGQECIYNTRRVIAPYELDVYFDRLNIAFEYDGKGWHQNDTIDKVELCKEKGILLIKLFERSRKYEEDIKNYLIENLEIINNWCNTNISIEDILSFNERVDFPTLFTEEELYILRNNERAFLRKNHLNLYNRYYTYNPDNKVFTTVIWTEDTVNEGLKEYSSVRELLRNNHGLYLAVHKKFRHLLPLYNRQLNLF